MRVHTDVEGLNSIRNEVKLTKIEINIDTV